MTTTDRTAAILVRYLNLGGALVIVTRDPADERDHNAACTGCLDGTHSPGTLHAARKWASEHAATCRALPQPEN